MLTIVVPLSEGFNEATSEFVDTEVCKLDLEHSLLSLSKWESRWERPFLGNETKSDEEVLDYVRAMILGPEPDETVFSCLTPDNFKAIDAYINAKMTATTFRELKQDKPNQEVVTAEIIYYWMITLNIPVQFENWHLNRLLTLIRVFNIKNAPKEKMSRADVVRNQRELNAQRRAAAQSRG